ncbi:hypothetical protein DFH09DRAFT_1106513 [Mycena vulgaris]|nr:hypothetical protein DFH09DRAFT_1106513 [Mycena vulgaris]
MSNCLELDLRPSAYIETCGERQPTIDTLAEPEEEARTLDRHLQTWRTVVLHLIRLGTRARRHALLPVYALDANVLPPCVDEMVDRSVRALSALPGALGGGGLEADGEEEEGHERKGEWIEMGTTTYSARSNLMNSLTEGTSTFDHGTATQREQNLLHDGIHRYIFHEPVIRERPIHGEGLEDKRAWWGVERRQEIRGVFANRNGRAELRQGGSGE